MRREPAEAYGWPVQILERGNQVGLCQLHPCWEGVGGRYLRNEHRKWVTRKLLKSGRAKVYNIIFDTAIWHILWQPWFELTGGVGGLTPFSEFLCLFHCDLRNPLVPAVLLTLPVHFSQFQPWLATAFSVSNVDFMFFMNSTISSNLQFVTSLYAQFAHNISHQFSRKKAYCTIGFRCLTMILL